MSEKPILFSGPMVRAILGGTKSQTRRIVKPQLEMVRLSDDKEAVPAFTGKLCAPGFLSVGLHVFNTPGNASVVKCPHGSVGDHLWVKETFLNNALDGYEPVYFYRADGEDKPSGRKWKPSIFMPRKASRITLEITGIRVERLNEISDADALSEGVTIQQDAKIASHYLKGEQTPAQLEYYSLWESINGKGSWAANPWVWVIAFKRI